VSPLPTFEDLKRALSSELTIIKEDQRDDLVRKISDLVARKVELEKLQQHYEKMAPDFRGSIRMHKKVLTQLANAIDAIETAKKIAEPEDSEMLKNFDVIRAQELLLEAAKDIAWVAFEFFPGWIYPDLRKGQEQSTKFKPPTHAVAQLPGLGVAAVNHWLIIQLDECLDDFVTPKGEKIKAGRDNLIAKVFKTAFGWTYEIKAINSVRQRKRTPLSKSPRNLPQN
jgi:hypothetical protein